MVALTPEMGDDVVISADLHGHRLNFQKIFRVADLDGHPRRHMIMQEVCHGGPKYPGHLGCMSHLLLEDVARLKVTYPDRFHFLLSNHEMAEIADYPISKGGQMLNLQLRTGLQTMYGNAEAEVRIAFCEFLFSCPLAIRTSPKTFVCHGSPKNVREDGFDIGIFERELSEADVRSRGDAFRLVWGRDFRESNASGFAELIGAKLLIHGHEPCPEGHRTPNDWQIILDCCGEKASCLVLPIGEDLTHGQAVSRIQRL